MAGSAVRDRGRRDVTDDIFEHLDGDDIPEEIEEFAHAAMPGGGAAFKFDIRDPDAIDQIRAELEESLERARTSLHLKLAAERRLYLRATQPGFFDYALAQEKTKMPAVIRAEFIAQAALERRISAIEGLVSEKLCALDVEVTG